MFADIYSWATGGDTYHTLLQCMNGDLLTASIVVGLCLSIALGYIVIAIKWWQMRETVPNHEAREALSYLVKVFLYCALCGHVWTGIKMFFPVWRIYAIFLFILSFYTWRFILSSKGLMYVFDYFRQVEAIIKPEQENGPARGN